MSLGIKLRQESFFRGTSGGKTEAEPADPGLPGNGR